MGALCQLCQKTPVYEPLNPEAIRMMKDALLVEAPDYNPIVCDICFDRVINNAPSMGVGQFSNGRTNNLLLR